MVGNYLTTLNQPVEKDLQMLRDLGSIRTGTTISADQTTGGGCDSSCGCEDKPAEDCRDRPKSDGK
ncbi:MAG: hypothetical protein Ct9H300mP32_0480 [Verrucomicrobiota bacterium]|nr:MAG: hypothetical protein Ct9H300mP32_0480 [Verrucomicrobiota bacterium]